MYRGHTSGKGLNGKKMTPPADTSWNGPMDNVINYYRAGQDQGGPFQQHYVTSLSQG